MRSSTVNTSSSGSGSSRTTSEPYDTDPSHTHTHTHTKFMKTNMTYSKNLMSLLHKKYIIIILLLIIYILISFSPHLPFAVRGLQLLVRVEAEGDEDHGVIGGMLSNTQEKN